MKVGILKLLEGGYSVVYTTGPERWTFFLRAARGKKKSLYYKVSPIKSPTTDTTVIVGGHNVAHLKRKSKPVGEAIFDPTKYLFLADAGEIASAARGDLFLNLSGSGGGKNPFARLYVKDMFVEEKRKLGTSVNLRYLNKMNRDRGAVIDDDDFFAELASIWGEVILRPESEELRERLLGYAQDEEASFIESELVAYLGQGAAEAMVAHLKKKLGADMFPVTKGNELQSDVVRGSLRKRPFQCSPRMLSFLRESKEIQTAEQAQSDAFISGDDSHANVGDCILAVKLKEFLSGSPAGDEIKVSFRKKSLGLDGLFKDGTLFLSEGMVLEPTCIDGVCRYVKLKDENGVGHKCFCGLVKVISVAERELNKNSDGESRLTL